MQLGTQQTAYGKEQVIGVWKHSRLAGGFWWRTLLTLGIYAFIENRQNQIVLTNERVTWRHGSLFAESEVTIPLARIGEVSVTKPFLGELFHYGNIMIEAIGANQQAISFRGLANPDQLRDAIFNLQQGNMPQMPPQMPR